MNLIVCNVMNRGKQYTNQSKN